MVRSKFDPLSGGHAVEGWEHEGHFPSKKEAHQHVKNLKERQKVVEHSDIKEHEQPNWGTGKGDKK